ncbi:MAG: Holliday junction DNA helicase RuvA [Verrucomicrobia bacterium GWC2_42_7]|nr:MAG: Holliday junction DNA helicase RuvA [Verrucomicrobia bacterium GWC2_42_7]
MIANIEGTLEEITPSQGVVNVGGIGYEVNMPLTTAETLLGIGKKVKLFTYVVYREDNQTLYGFKSREERDFFKVLIEKVSGVGPKLALAILSKLSLSLLKSAIAHGDISTLSSCPGIGKKTAERLIIELKDKMGLHEAHITLPGHETSREINAIEDAVSALVALGYKTADADKAVRKALASHKDLNTEELVKKVLTKRKD